MIKYGSETIPDLQIPIPDQFVVPEVRWHLYVPGSGVADISLFGKFDGKYCIDISALGSFSFVCLCDMLYCIKF